MGPKGEFEMADYKLVAGSGSVNFSAPSFHRWAFHYYKCVQDFQSPDRWSPVPYALLCRAIELELKSRHLELTPGQRNVKEKFSHDLQKLYEALPADQRVLTGTELEVLRTASQVQRRQGF